MKTSILQTACAFLMGGTLFAQTPPPQTTGADASPGTKRIRPKNAEAPSLKPPPLQETGISKSKIVRPGVDDVSLNPQPLPPVDAPAKSKIVRPGVDDVSLNPQPLPPVDAPAKSKIARPGVNDVSLNPQPLPPVDAPAKSKIARPGVNDVSLNPQPLPPVDAPAKSKIVRPGVNDVSLNPQPLPPVDGDKIRTQRAAETALNPQPLPPVDSFLLSNGRRARMIGRKLMVTGANGETKASAGQYKTKDGRVLIVNRQGEVAR